METDKNIQNCINFFQSKADKINPIRTYAWWIDGKNGKIDDGPCHAQMHLTENWEILGSGFYTGHNIKTVPPREWKPEDTKRIGLKFWNWITDVHNSPWKEIAKLKPVPILHPKDKDVFLGWYIINPKDGTSPHPNFLKNFCILTRIFSEKFAKIRSWDKFTEKGMDESEAFYLCSAVVNSGVANETSFTTDAFGITGGHWPLTDNYDKANGNFNYHFQINWNTYRNGNIPKVANKQPINGFFLKKENDDKEYKWFKLDDYKDKVEILNGKFSRLTIMDIDNTIKAFRKWQLDYNILGDL